MAGYMEVAPTTQITFDLYGKLCGISGKFKELFNKGKQEEAQMQSQANMQANMSAEADININGGETLNTQNVYTQEAPQTPPQAQPQQQNVPPQNEAPKAAFCGQCGTKITAGTAFCGNCGAKLN